jgi:16S rRNA (cytidine1402-2'-O)-methyltransferase
MPGPGTLFVVATPIGNLEDVTMRALRVLREVAVIAAEDTRRTAHLLARYDIRTPTVSLHEHNEKSRTLAILARLERGESVALVSDAGTPAISDPGRLLVEAARNAGQRVEPVPGPNAAITALAISGFAADTFTFLGFPPTRSKDRTKWLDILRAAHGAVVFYEAPHRVRRTLGSIRDVIGDVELLVARELTKAHEQTLKTTLSAFLALPDEPRGEYTIVLNIGHKTDLTDDEAPGPADFLSEFGRLVDDGAKSRRAAISELARRHRVAPNTIYKLLESAKK